jgi:hypothetical protein
MTIPAHSYMQADSGQGNLPLSEIFVQAWESVCTYRTYACARFVTALSICEGAVTGPAPRFRSNPARPSFSFGRRVPSSREGDRNLELICASRSIARFPPAQLTKRRMRMFITMPSAKNMNRTEEPP